MNWLNRLSKDLKVYLGINMTQYKRIITKKCEWLDKEAGIWNEDYDSEITIFGFIHWSYKFTKRHDMSKLGSNRTIVTGMVNKTNN